MQTQKRIEKLKLLYEKAQSEKKIIAADQASKIEAKTISQEEHFDELNSKYFLKDFFKTSVFVMFAILVIVILSILLTDYPIAKDLRQKWNLPKLEVSI